MTYILDINLKDEEKSTLPGGLWGARINNSVIRQMLTANWDQMLEDPMAYSSRDKKGPDEKLIDKYIYPWAQYFILAHDSFL